MPQLESINVNEELYWLNGSSTLGIKQSQIVNTGDEIYWCEGSPVMSLYPKSNQDTGKFFLFLDI